jgi:glycerol transport system permease protein
MTKSKLFGLIAYVVFLLLPIYWLLNMSFKENQEILSGLSFFPENWTFRNYQVIF